MHRRDAARQDLERRGLVAPDNQHTTDTQTPDNRHTTDTQTPDERHTLNRRDFRISDDDWTRLQDNARRRGLSVSAVLRELVKEYLRGRG